MNDRIKVGDLVYITRSRDRKAFCSDALVMTAFEKRPGDVLPTCLIRTMDGALYNATPHAIGGPLRKGKANQKTRWVDGVWQPDPNYRRRRNP